MIGNNTIEGTSITKVCCNRSRELISYRLSKKCARAPEKKTRKEEECVFRNQSSIIPSGTKEEKALTHILLEYIKAVAGEGLMRQ